MSAKKRKTRSAGKRKTITAVEDEPIREKLGLLESAGKEDRKGATRSVGKVKYPPHPVILAALWGTGVLISMITAIALGMYIDMPVNRILNTSIMLDVNEKNLFCLDISLLFSIFFLILTCNFLSEINGILSPHARSFYVRWYRPWFQMLY